MKKTFVLFALILLIAFFFLKKEGSLFNLWKNWLLVSVPMQKADVLIVLGGEPQARPLLAAKLFKEGVADKIFISGVGDFKQNRDVLLASGVPKDSISVESNSITTFTNATMLKPMLENAHIRSALIITSPFHTRRALATFRKVMPDIKFGVTDASINWWKTPPGIRGLNRFVLLEFLKIPEYWIFYGVSPFLDRG